MILLFNKLGILIIYYVLVKDFFIRPGWELIFIKIIIKKLELKKLILKSINFI